jgi:branched-chain amino acid transport system ATP-binding protein
MTAPMLQVDNLEAGYAGTIVLWDVTFDVMPGEVVAMVGRNGMGKSTLMRTLMGFLKARRGTIHYRGEDITGVRTDRRARGGIGYVPQGRLIFPDLTVEENLRMGDRVGVSKPDRTLQFERVYAMFPILAERRSQRGGTLSGGQQQMLAIGRALVGDPDILLLDEPSEGIQPSVVGEIEQHVLALRRALNLTIFVVEQDCQFIKTVADRCYVLERGRAKSILRRDEFAHSDRLEIELSL